VTSDWIYYNIYPKSIDLLDLVVENLVSTAVSVVNEATDLYRWFFIRYRDFSGAHIRLRFLVPVEDIAHVIQLLECIFNEKLPEINRREGFRTKRLIPVSSDLLNIEQESRFELAVYEPETEKYGGNIGLAIAEEWFQKSSELCLKMSQGIHNGSLNRFIIGLKYMDIALHVAFNCAEERLQFLNRYLSHWSGEQISAIGPAYKNQILTSAGRRRALTKKLLSDDAGEMHIDEFRLSLENVMEQLVKRNVNKPFDDLLFHFIHMKNNRLGIWPIEEAYLAALLQTVYEDAAMEAGK
jgi:thiopeptide-type bacteriocin biosynthesis protein